MTDPRPSPESGPVPVRDLLKQTGAGASAPAEAEAPALAARDRLEDTGAAPAEGQVGERAFEVADETWLARPAGVGLYGTGRLGSARLVAVHFFRVSEPERPVREALVPASDFRRLEPAELRVVFERATPIELER
jgi:hypothetical protein